MNKCSIGSFSSSITLFLMPSHSQAGISFGFTGKLVSLQLRIFLLFFVCLSTVSCVSNAAEKAVADSSTLKPPAPTYLDNNKWAGEMTKCCRMLKPTVLPATIIFSSDRAQLKTSGKHTCDVEYIWLKGEKKKYSLNGKTITRDIYESTGSYRGHCREMQYLTIGKGNDNPSTALSISMSRRKNGVTDYNSLFKPSEQTISDLVACEQLVKHSTKGDTAGVQSALARGANPNCVFNRQTALYNAVRHIRVASDRNLPIIRQLVEAGARLDVKDLYTGGTPTTLAAYLGHDKTTDYLLSAGGSQKDIEEASRRAKTKVGQLLDAIDLGIKIGEFAKEEISEALKSGANAPSVSVRATDVCGVLLNQCIVSKLQVSGNNPFDKILDDSNQGVITAQNWSGLSGSYNYSVRLDDVTCLGEFNIKNGMTSVELQIAKDGCRLLSVIQN